MFFSRLPFLSCLFATLIILSTAKDIRIRVRGPDLANKNVRVRLRLSNSTLIANKVAKPFKVSEVCGLSTIKLIQGGDKAQPDEFPWLGALFISNPKYKNYLCTVNLVTTKHLLTAAHCMSLSTNMADYYIIFGFTKGEERIKLTISNYDQHPSYVKSGAAHDIAILSLTVPLTFSTSIRPICIGQPTLLSNNNLGTVAGFGPDYTTYQKIDMPLIEMSRCHDSNELFRSLVTTNTFCAGNRDNNGPCKGDSGAGYMQYSGDRIYLRGLVSLSLQNNGTCNLRQYIIFANVLMDTDWIKRLLSDFLT